MQTLATVSRPITKASSLMVKIVPFSLPEIAASRGLMFLEKLTGRAMSGESTRTGVFEQPIRIDNPAIRSDSENWGTIADLAGFW